MRSPVSSVALFRINGVTVTAPNMDMAVRQVVNKFNIEKSFYICTLNLDHLVKLEADDEFRRVYNAAELVTADGFPIVYLARREGVNLTRTTGADLVEPLCAAAAEQDVSVFFVGTTESTLRACIGSLLAKWPTLKIVGAVSPSFCFDPEGAEAREICKQIAASGAKLCFVGLGAPKQEIFSAMAVMRVSGVAFIPIGAALEYIAKTKMRAPSWVQYVGCEWLWRLAAEPRRLTPRYFKSAVLLARIYFRKTYSVVYSEKLLDPPLR